MATSERRPRNRARLTRKELKAPDEFLTLTGRVLTLASAHLRLIVTLVGGVVVGGILLWSLLVYLDRLEQQAFAALAHIEGQLRNGQGGEDLSPALAAQLQEIAHRFGAGEARGYAWLNLGHAAYRKGEYATALTAYRQGVAEARPASILWSLANLGVGYALEGSGDFAEAQKAYQRVIDANPPGFLAEAYLGKGRAAEGSQDVSGAMATYAAVMQQFPQYAETVGLAEKVSALKARN